MAIDSTSRLNGKMRISTQLLLVLLLNLRVQCARVGISKAEIGPVQLWAEKGSRRSETFKETFSFHYQRSSGEYDGDHPEISSRPLADDMDLQPSQYLEHLVACASLEVEVPELSFLSPGPEEIMIVSVMETVEHDSVAFPSIESVALANFDPQPSEAPNLDSMLLSSDLNLQPFETTEFVLIVSQSPAAFASNGVSASTGGLSEVLTGRTSTSRIVGITVAFVIAIAMLLTVVMIIIYGRSINPYRPFITGASLSEMSFDLAREPVPEVSNDVYNSRESNSQSRRYEATSLNRDIEPAKRLEAAKLLEDIPDRHCR